MSWAPFLRPAKVKAGPKTQSFVQLRVAAVGRYRQRVTILVRPSLAQTTFAWWRLGAFVSLAFGDGADAGRLRITPAEPGAIGAWPLRGPTGKAAGISGGGVVRLILQDVPDLPPEGLPATECAFELGHERLVLTLPPALRRKPAEVPSTGPAPKQPYKGVAASTGLGNGVGRPSRAVLA